MSARSRTVHSNLMRREVTGCRVIPRGSGQPLMTWGAAFHTLLGAVLGSKPYWADLDISDCSNTEEQVVVIESFSEVRDFTNAFMRGDTNNRLYIEVRHNHPQHGFSSDPTRADNWSAACWTVRGCRITLRPPQEFTCLVQTLPRTPPDSRDTKRFRGFLTWNHGVYRRLAPTEHLAVYHDDFSISEPAVKVVSMAIEEHFRLAAGRAPAAGAVGADL